MSETFDTTAFDAALARVGGGAPSVTIGFNTDYAAAVHERLDLRHKQGQAKFLEAAMNDAVNRQLVEKSIESQMQSVTDTSQIHAAIAKGIEIAAVQILSNAQQLCPIDTGALAASATWQGTDGPGDGQNPANIRVAGASKKKAADDGKIYVHDSSGNKREANKWEIRDMHERGEL